MWVTVNYKDQPARINTDFIILLRPEQHTLTLSSGDHMKLSEKDYGEVEATLFPKRKKYSSDDTEIAAFLNELHRLTGGKNEAILTPQRKKKLLALLQSMTKEQLITSATNIGKDAFLQGENDRHKRYGDVDFLLRPDKAAKYAEVDENKRKKLF